MVFLLLGVVLWYLGRQTSDLSSENDLKVLGNINGGFVKLPVLLYVICGMPRSKKLPDRVVTTRSLMSQLAGLFFLVYGYFDQTKKINIAGPEIFVLLLLAGIVVGYVLRRFLTYHS